MSENVQQILVRGIAAAKSQASVAHAEAYTDLKQVLRSSAATSDQKATAWLWLSQLENDVADKQFCLEQVLEFDPTNGLAQRGLVILKKQLLQPLGVNPNRPIESSHPAENTGPGAPWRSSCPQCGGTMEFEVTHNQLTCQYCGYHREPHPTLHHVAGEQNFLATLPTRQAQSWHLAIAQTLKCSGCGATFTLPKLEVSGECPFCGSLHVISTILEDDLIEPDGILTFQLDQREARQAMKAWLAQQHPQKHSAPLSRRLRAIYLPYWTFDLDGEIIIASHLQIQDLALNFPLAGEWVRYIHPVYHDDLLVPATRTVPRELLDQVSNFSTSSLQPYSSEILAAWSAEVYQISLADASLIARQHAVGAARQDAQFVLGSIELQLPHTARIDSTPLCVQSYKLVLLPVWLGRYRLQDQIYRLVVNGQTGKTSGEKPPEGWRQKLDRLFGAE
jgi:DNA-directed RNA polymerase subunit RPC12/RpoP